MNNKISVIVPIYNSEKYLDKCLKSLEHQTYKNTEIILVDDGSTDNSGKICDKYCTKNNNFKTIHTDNRGVSNARNIGISISSGEYIAFIDSDDWVEEDYIEKLIYNIDENIDLNIVDFCSNTLEKSSFVFDFLNYNSKQFLYLIKRYLLYGPMVKLYRSQIIKNNNLMFPMQLDFGEDLCFNFDYLKHCKKIKYTSYQGYHYTTENTQSLSRKFRLGIYDNTKYLLNLQLDFLKLKKIEDLELSKFLYRQLFDSAYNLLFDVLLISKDLTLIKKYKFVKQLLNDTNLQQAIKIGDLNGYSPMVLSLMKSKRTLLTLLYIAFGTIYNKRRFKLK